MEWSFKWDHSQDAVLVYPPPSPALNHPRHSTALTWEITPKYSSPLSTLPDAGTETPSGRLNGYRSIPTWTGRKTVLFRGSYNLIRPPHPPSPPNPFTHKRTNMCMHAKVLVLYQHLLNYIFPTIFPPFFPLPFFSPHLFNCTLQEYNFLSLFHPPTHPVLYGFISSLNFSNLVTSSDTFLSYPFHNPMLLHSVQFFCTQSPLPVHSLLQHLFLWSGFLTCHSPYISPNSSSIVLNLIVLWRLQ